MPTRRGDRMPGGHDARPVDPAGVDGLAQRDVQQVTTGLDEQSQVADRREPGAQRAAGVTHRTQHPGRRIVLHLGQAGTFAPPAHQQVDLHVHQAGQQDRIAEIDHLTLGLAADPDDPVAVDLDDAGTDDLARIDIDQTPLL